MGDMEKRPTIGEAQRELTVLAADAERLTRRTRELGQQLDAPLAEAQAQGLEPETLKTYVASWLLTTDDVSLSDAAERLGYLARLRQADVDAAWKERFPLVLADEASRRLGALGDAAEAVREAARRGDEPLLATTVESLCCQMEDGGPDLDDLAARGRRYLTRDDAGRRRTPSGE